MSSRQSQGLGWVGTVHELRVSSEGCVTQSVFYKPRVQFWVVMDINLGPGK